MNTALINMSVSVEEYAALERLYKAACYHARPSATSHEYLDWLRRNVTMTGHPADLSDSLLKRSSLERDDVRVCRRIAARIGNVALAAFCDLAMQKEWI